MAVEFNIAILQPQSVIYKFSFYIVESRERYYIVERICKSNQRRILGKVFNWTLLIEKIRLF